MHDIYEYVGPLDTLGSPQDAHGWLGWALVVKVINRHHGYVFCTILHSVLVKQMDAEAEECGEDKISDTFAAKWLPKIAVSVQRGNA